MVNPFKKKEPALSKSDVQRETSYLSDLQSQKDPEVVALIQMLTDLTEQDGLVWEYNWTYKYVDLEDGVQIRIEGTRQGDVALYSNRNVFYSCQYPELFVLNANIKQSQIRKHQKEKAENMQKVKEILENKLKAPQVK